MNDDRFGKDAPEGGFSQNCSLRDYFAGQALIPCIEVAVNIEASGHELKKSAPATIAEMAYQIADAMLKERAK
jgi:hypothetical protein